MNDESLRVKILTEENERLAADVESLTNAPPELSLNIAFWGNDFRVTAPMPSESDMIADYVATEGYSGLHSVLRGFLVDHATYTHGTFIVRVEPYVDSWSNNQARIKSFVITQGTTLDRLNEMANSFEDLVTDRPFVVTAWCYSTHVCLTYTPVAVFRADATARTVSGKQLSAARSSPTPVQNTVTFIAEVTYS